MSSHRSPLLTFTFSEISSSVSYVQHVRVSLGMFSVMMLTMYCIISSFTMTSMLHTCILLSMSPVYIVIIEISRKLSVNNVMLLVFVLLSIIGIITMSITSSTLTLADTGSTHNGDVFAFVSSVLIAIYTMLTKKLVCDNPKIHTQLFLAFCGLWSACLWPVIFLMSYVNMENAQVITVHAFGSYAVIAVVMAVLIYVATRAVAFSSSVVSSSLVMLVYPTVVITALVMSYSATYIVQQIIGLVIVLTGVIGAVVYYHHHEVREVDEEVHPIDDKSVDVSQPSSRRSSVTEQDLVFNSSTSPSSLYDPFSPVDSKLESKVWVACVRIYLNKCLLTCWNVEGLWINYCFYYKHKIDQWLQKFSHWIQKRRRL